jgi:cell division septation protein DedD
LEILDKEVQKWIEQGTGGLFKKSGLDQARVVKESQSKDRAEIDSLIKSSQERIGKLREQYASQVTQYNDRVSAIEARSKSQRSDTEASIKKLEKENEDTIASIDVYNKETDAKIAALNAKKGELAEMGVKKVVEYQNEIQALRNQNTDYKDKIVKTDVGTFKFIAKSLGVPLDTAVNYFIWSIMLVFDPLAVCLILAYNTLVGKKKEQILPVATPVITPNPTATPEPTISPSPTPSATPEPTPSPTPEPTPEPSQQIEQKDPYNEQLQNRIEPVKASSTEAPPAAFIRDYEHFSRPNP